MPSRREFLRSTIALAAGGCIASVSAQEPARFGAFRMGMATYSLRAFPLPRAVELMKSLGIETIDLNPRHLPFTAGSDAIDEAKRNVAAHQLALLSYGVVNNFTNDHAGNKRIFELARRLEVRNLTANPREDSLDSIEQLADEFDIRVAIHNHGPGSTYDKVTDVLSVLKNRHTNIGACADLGHYIRSGEDPVRCIALLEGRLYGIHLKDFDAPRKDARGCILGKGVLDVPAVFRMLKKVNFPANACLSLEYEENEKDPIADIQACLEVASAAARST